MILVLTSPAVDFTFHYRQWLGWRIASTKGKTKALAPLSRRYPYFEEYRVKRRVCKGADEPSPERLADPVSKKWQTYPCLLAHLTTTAYEDGSRREPGWVTVATSGKAWRVTAKDPDSASSMSVTAPTVDEAMMALEMILSNPEAPWEPDAFLKARKKRR